jgi:hypothetical protein
VILETESSGERRSSLPVATQCIGDLFRTGQFSEAAAAEAPARDCADAKNRNFQEAQARAAAERADTARKIS